MTLLSQDEMREKIADTLKDHALKLVANAHSEMTGEQWDFYTNEVTRLYIDGFMDFINEQVEAAVEEELQNIKTEYALRFQAFQKKHTGITTTLTTDVPYTIFHSIIDDVLAHLKQCKQNQQNT